MFKNLTRLVVPLSTSNLRYFSTKNNLLDVTVQEKTGIATVTLNRPPVNSLNLELLNDIKTTLQECENNRVKGLILTSSSSKVFTAGLDINEFYKPNPDRLSQFWTTLQDVWLALYGSTFPTVAVINGHAPAGGCLMAMCCEYRVMLPDFTIGLNETQLGIIAPPWFIATMRNTIGRRQTEIALTTGKLFTTEEAHQIGLIDDRANSKDEALAKAGAFLQKFAKISPFARAATKISLRGNDLEELIKNRQKDLDMVVSLLTDEKLQHGLGLYLESLKKKKQQ